MISNWSAPEIWESHYKPKNEGGGDDEYEFDNHLKYDPKITFFNRPSVDIYSFGFLLWELETAQMPFETETKNEVF